MRQIFGPLTRSLSHQKRAEEGRKDHQQLAGATPGPLETLTFPGARPKRVRLLQMSFEINSFEKPGERSRQSPVRWSEE